MFLFKCLIVCYGHQLVTNCCHLIGLRGGWKLQEWIWSFPHIKNRNSIVCLTNCCCVETGPFLVLKPMKIRAHTALNTRSWEEPVWEHSIGGLHCVTIMEITNQVVADVPCKHQEYDQNWTWKYCATTLASYFNSLLLSLFKCCVYKLSLYRQTVYKYGHSATASFILIRRSGPGSSVCVCVGLCVCVCVMNITASRRC